MTAADPGPKAEPLIAAIQVLRAGAAVMVLVFHTAYMANLYGGYNFAYSNTGAAGVDVFFVISGFIVAYINRSGVGSPVTFVRRRLIRIVPAYWFYTTLTLATLVLIPAAYAHLTFDTAHVVLSYLFVLSSDNQHVVGTLLGVGWTICFEIYFYALSSAFMFAPLAYRTAGLSVVVVSGALLEGTVAAPPFAEVILSALPLEFLAGYLYGRLYLRGVSLPGLPAILAIGLAAVALYAAGAANVVASERDPWRVVYFGIPALALVVGLVSLEVRKRVSYPRLALAIGEASYSLYLSHLFVLYAIGKCWRAAHLDASCPAPVLFCVAVGVSLGAAVLAYRWFERPTTVWLNETWGRRSPVVAPAL